MIIFYLYFLVTDKYAYAIQDINVDFMFKINVWIAWSLDFKMFQISGVNCNENVFFFFFFFD